MTATAHLLPDATLIERIAALRDREALAELDRRHGMTLYAIAYTVLLDSDASDAVVAMALREVWRQAGSFEARLGTAAGWLSELTRRAARDRLREPRRLPAARPARAPVSAAREQRPRRASRLARVMLARAVRFAAVVVPPFLTLRWLRP